MQFYTIPVSNQLELIKLGDRAFCLTQLYIKDENYRNYFKQLKKDGWWITMDSGVGDHDPVDQDTLFEAMKDLMPSEVIPVDTLFNKEETIANLEDFIIRMRKEDLLDKIEIFGCPQASTLEGWMECYIYMLNHPSVKTIGLSKITVPKVFMNSLNDVNIMESRHECVDVLLENDLVRKPLHFLGMGNPSEMKKYVALNNNLFRSTDSCNSCWSALNGLSWSKGELERIPTPKDYFDRSMNEEQITLFKENISWFRKILNLF